MLRLVVVVVVLLAGCSDRQVALDGAADLSMDTGCPDGLTLCDGQCVDTTDPKNCGDCGNKCDTDKGFGCINGSCACIDGETDCGGECVDTNRDPANCGGCDLACSPIEFCHVGHCGHDDCGPPPLACCDGAVVDTSSDPNNCGGCGVKCDTAKGFTCSASMCACIGGHKDCFGQCVDVNSDPQHCGDCKRDCWLDACGEYGVCTSGACSSACAAPLCVCNGSCVDLQSDNQNCGSCNQICQTAKGFTCQKGQCQCVSLLTECGGPCVDPYTDPDHCGGCNIKCLSGSCSEGVCQGDAGVVYPDAGVDGG